MCLLSVFSFVCLLSVFSLLAEEEYASEEVVAEVLGVGGGKVTLDEWFKELEDGDVG